MLLITYVRQARQKTPDSEEAILHAVSQRLRPVLSREKVGKRTLRDLVSGFFGGSPRQVFSYLIKEEKLSEEDLEALRQLIEERQKKGK